MFCTVAKSGDRQRCLDIAKAAHRQRGLNYSKLGGPRNESPMVIRPMMTSPHQSLPRVSRGDMSRMFSSNACLASDANHPHFPKLFEPLDLGNGIPPLSNRVIMGSMHTGLEGHSIPRLLSYFLRDSKAAAAATDQPHLSHAAELAEYYAERARAGTSLIVTGGISPNRTGALTPFGSKLTSAQEIEFHTSVTNHVAKANSNTKMILQILHAGRYSAHPFLVAPSPIKSVINSFKPRQLSVSEIRSTVDDYENCAKLAYQSGYSGVELMGSEGYLIHQFICPRTNARGDEYGGSYKNRIKFPLDIVRAIRSNPGIPETFIILFRLSMLDLVDNGSTWEEIILLGRELELAGVTIINTGIGWHESRVPTIATKVPNGAYTWVTQNMKPHLSIPICTTNRINTPEHVERILSSGQTDLVSMARPFLADPEFIQKAFEGKSDEVNTCIGCNQVSRRIVFNVP